MSWYRQLGNPFCIGEPLMKKHREEREALAQK
jgi:hypothetical protein